jgi:transposase
MSQLPDRVVIGMDPHKRSVTVEVMARDETVLDRGRFATDRDGAAAMFRFAARWPQRTWAIEGCNGIGRHVANRLLADSQDVVDVPPKLSARARVFATGQGRKTDATDAHSIALVGTRMAGLRPVANDEQLAVLRILVDRRRCLGEDHTRMVSQLHHLLLELIPGGAKKDLSAAQAKALLARVRPRDAAGKARRRVAAELISDLERIHQRKKAANKELKQLVAATGSTLMDLHGIGPSGAARLLVEIGDIARFPNRDHFASWNGTAPIDASSGDQLRHRLSRAGNRQINPVLHIMATVHLRNPTGGRLRRQAESRRQDLDAGHAGPQATAVRHRHRRMLDDATSGAVTGPGGQQLFDTEGSQKRAYSSCPTAIHCMSWVRPAPAAMHRAASSARCGHRPSLTSSSRNPMIIAARSASRSPRPSAISRSSAIAASMSSGPGSVAGRRAGDPGVSVPRTLSPGLTCWSRHGPCCAG